MSPNLTFALLLLPLGAAAADPLIVFFVDPTHLDFSGDAMVVCTPSGHHYVMDGGYMEDYQGSYWSCGEARVLPLLDSLEVDYLDGVLATHPDADHVGGLIAVVNHYQGVLGTVWDSGWPYGGTWIYEEFLQEVEQSGASYVVPRRGDLLDWDDLMTVEVVHPVDPLDPASTNNASVSVRMTYGEVTFLFTGDMETEGGEDVILDAVSSGIIDDITADVLKVAHHGSRTSTGDEWLDAVQPTIAAICVGAGNPYGHPHSEVLTRLYARGIDVCRTDQSGTFYMATDGDSIYVNSLPPGGGQGPEEVDRLIVYPSPATTRVTFAWDSSGETTGTISVYNLLGERVLYRSASGGSCEWDLSLEDGGLLSPGLYMAHLVTEGGETCTEYFAVSR